MRAALAAVLAAGLAGCGPDATPAPTRGYVTYLAENEAAATAIRPYLKSVEATFGLRARIEVAPVPAVPAGSAAESVIPADPILDALFHRRKADEEAVVALVMAQLREGADPASQLVYGRGRSERSAAVIGLGALPHTGLKAGRAEVESRRLRVFLHETGHALGRDHCDDPWCLMAETNGPKELDRTALVPCDVCLASYAAAHSLEPAVIREAAESAAKAHGWTIDPPTKKAVEPERAE
jgi:predicted Zn-dependent protease